MATDSRVAEETPSRARIPSTTPVRPPISRALGVSSASRSLLWLAVLELVQNTLKKSLSIRTAAPIIMTPIAAIVGEKTPASPTIARAMVAIAPNASMMELLATQRRPLPRECRLGNAAVVVFIIPTFLKLTFPKTIYAEITAVSRLDRGVFSGADTPALVQAFFRHDLLRNSKALGCSST